MSNFVNLFAKPSLVNIDHNKIEICHDNLSDFVRIKGLIRNLEERFSLASEPKLQESEKIEQSKRVHGNNRISEQEHWKDMQLRRVAKTPRTLYLYLYIYFHLYRKTATHENENWTKVCRCCRLEDFNELPLDARKLESRLVFTSFLNEHFS